MRSSPLFFKPQPLFSPRRILLGLGLICLGLAVLLLGALDLQNPADCLMQQLWQNMSGYVQHPAHRFVASHVTLQKGGL